MSGQSHSPTSPLSSIVTTEFASEIRITEISTTALFK